MPLRTDLIATCTLIACCAGLPALAQEGPQARDAGALSFGAGVPSAAEGVLSTQSARNREVIFTFLLGVQSRPAYFGSDENRVVPLIRPNLLALSFGEIGVGDVDGALPDDPIRRPLGFGFAPSFRFITERNSDDYSELDGLDDVDATLELGAQVGYVWRNAEAFGQLRYGFGGSEAWVGEVGAFYVTRPAEGFALRIGPRFLFGSEQYADTYFGVSSEESAASGLAEYDPDGGLMTAGIELIATYRLGEQWWLEGRARWDQYQDSAADSPIVEQGARDQGTVSIGVRRAFVLEF